MDFFQKTHTYLPYIYKPIFTLPRKYGVSVRLYIYILYNNVGYVLTLHCEKRSLKKRKENKRNSPLDSRRAATSIHIYIRYTDAAAETYKEHVKKSTKNSGAESNARANINIRDFCLFNNKVESISE